MKKFSIRITNKIGLHLRAASEFVSVANSFSSKFTVILDGKKADGKSILGLASLAIRRGSVVTIQIDGPDEDEAKTAIVELIKNNFNEE